MTLEELQHSLTNRRSYLLQQRTRMEMLQTQITGHEQFIADSKDSLVTLDEAVALIGHYADSREAEVQAQIETLVTNGLKTVFEEDLKFIVQQKAVGKRTEIKFKIESFYDGVSVETDILSARGGGVAAVTGFLLRVIMILLTGSRRILFLDELFAQVSSEYLSNVAFLLEDLSQEYGFQFVLVSHRTQDIEDVSTSIYQASMTEGKTSYTKIS